MLRTLLCWGIAFVFFHSAEGNPSGPQNGGNDHSSFCRNTDRTNCATLAPCICHDEELGKLHCPYSCGHCKERSDHCNRGDRHSCKDLASCKICEDHELAKENCPHMCGFCDNTPQQSETAHHPQTSHHRTAATSNPATTPTPTPDLTTQDQTPAAATTEEATTTTLMTTTTSSSPPLPLLFLLLLLFPRERPRAIAPAPTPSKCMQCGEEKTHTPCTDDDLILGDAVLCDAATPYCMNDIYVNNGALAHYRRCVNETICYLQWFEGTSDKNLCVNFDPSISVFDLACHLCCHGDGCNINDVPAKATLYQP